jgi:hypothetical protein
MIPGYHEPPKTGSLFDLWPQPAGDLPDELWPGAVLKTIVPSPGAWLTVASHEYNEAQHGGVHSLLIDPESATQAIDDTSWIGRYIGETVILDDDRMENGLETTENGVRVEFFAQSSQPQGASSAFVDIHHPFLWYWDAFPNESGWSYVDRAGREQDLVRWNLAKNDWRIEVRTLELRTFLAHYKRSLLMQVDMTLKIEAPKFDRIGDSLRNDWAHFTFFATHESYMGDRPAFSGIMGQYVVSGVRTARQPRWAERKQDHEYPDFIYGVAPSSGEELLHTCDPEKLGTYFDKDDSRLHYLTPIYFKREVLQPYAAEPRRYSLSSHRLTCLGLWGVDLSINSANLVEVYLGDLGEKLPPDEWGHWKSYNVHPEGVMDEGRYRRDFLGQWASSKDPVRDLQRARQAAVDVSARIYGKPIWKPLDGSIRIEFESLMGPLNDDPSSLGGPLLTLTKVLVDAIDSRHLKTIVSTFEKGDQSLRLLTQLTKDIGDEDDTVDILRNLQSFRSKGGIAHLEGSQRSVAEAALGISDLSPTAAFELIVTQAIDCLTEITRLIEATAPSAQPHSGS